LEKAKDGTTAEPLAWKLRPQVAHETKRLSLEIAAAKTPVSLQRPPAITPIRRPSDKPRPRPKPTQSDDDADATESTTSLEVPHWTKQKERFPLPSSKIISLPTGKAKPIPKIQHVFKRETAEAKADREQKLETIKSVFQRSWDGYREYAWLQDELSPVSGKYRNPFAGWGATLVDSLDTLWIMGMIEDFEEAVNAVEKIDFTTVQRQDIPVFETTIRYLGGFLAAYDLSGGKYKVLLKKAVELAEVLMSVFDTPNRMPITYYRWMLSVLLCRNLQMSIVNI
jgi:mannosyl-oligosaccharide alpha-1,2-mannosidase